MSDHESVNRNAVATFSQPRIAYHPAIKERFDIDPAGWRALIDAVWPAAKTADAVVLALSYCKARNLDPFKRPVHIVPIWSREQHRMVESVWPGIGELRTTAFRTGLYAGRDKPEYGPEIEEDLGGTQIRYPEWCEITVYRLGRNGERMPYPGPRVYWTESYATAGRDTKAPNDMWRRRPHGQIEKCAEAAALRAAFPEELGNEYTLEEMEGQVIDPSGNIERAAAPAPPRPRREDYQDPPQTVTDVEPEPEHQEAEPFEVCDLTSEVFGSTNDAESAAELFSDALDIGEKQNGAAGLTAVFDSNGALLAHMEELGYAELAHDLATLYSERLAAATAKPAEEQETAEPSPTTERRRTKRTQAPNTDESNVTRVTEPASQQGTETSPPPHSKTAERPGPTVFPIGSGRGDPQPDSPAATPVEERSGAATERGAAAPERPITEEPSRASLWREASFYIEPPLLPNTARVNFPILRDMLCNLARDAQTRDEIGKFEADNQPNLRRLIEAFPQYGEQAVRAIADAKQRIGSGT